MTELEPLGSDLTIERRVPVDWVTLNTGDPYNTLTVQTAEALHRYFGSRVHDSECRAVVLQGQGEHFSAGLNLAAAKSLPTAGPEKVMETMKKFAAVTLEMRRCPQPIIALMRGNAVGGGLAPLGYDAKDRSLVINQKEAETAGHIYRRYLALGSVRALKEELDRDKIVTKQRVDRYGRQTGGNPFSRGALYHMLQNRVYRGEIVHKGESYPGKHEALIDEDLWSGVQAQLATSRVERSSGEGTRTPSLLAGLLYDDTGIRMTPSHANKNGARYRYYVSNGLITGNRRQTPTGRRMPAEDIERLVQDRITALLRDEGTLFEAFAPVLADAHQRRDLITAASELADGWPALEASEKRRMLQLLVARIELTPDGLTIEVSTKGVADTLAENVERPVGTLKSSTDRTARPVMLQVSADLKRVGQGKRYVVDGKGLGIRGAPNRYLLKLLGQAHRYKAMAMRGHGKTISQLATEAGVGRSYFTRILRLAFLSPESVRMILSGRHPRELTARRLAAETRLPIDWKEHRSMLGLKT